MPLMSICQQIQLDLLSQRDIAYTDDPGGVAIRPAYRSFRPNAKALKRSQMWLGANLTCDDTSHPCPCSEVAEMHKSADAPVVVGRGFRVNHPWSHRQHRQIQVQWSCQNPMDDLSVVRSLCPRITYSGMSPMSHSVPGRIPMCGYWRGQARPP